MLSQSSIGDLTSVQKAFGKQASHYDDDDFANPILTDWRKQVYEHINLFLKPKSHILELNSGTGIDAVHFVKTAHTVHATDVSPGMIQRIEEKINRYNLQEKLTVQFCPYESLNQLTGKNFDYLFSNFGGLNCCHDLTQVTRHLPGLLNDNAYVTLVIMPPVCLWELLSVFKGNKAAFRRLKKGGTSAHLEGEYFKSYYYSLNNVRRALGEKFRLLKTEGLGAISPPPSSLKFIQKYPGLYSILKKLDKNARYHFPFNRWADHIIVTFQYHK